MKFLAFFFFAFFLWRKNWTPAWLVGVHTSALISCDSLAVKSHIWLIIVIINQWDGWAVQGIIAASHCSHSSHLGAPHSPAVLGCSEGVWMMAMMGGALKPEAHICPPQLETEARGEAVTLEVQRTGTLPHPGDLCHAPELQTSRQTRHPLQEGGGGGSRRWRKESVLSFKTHVWPTGGGSEAPITTGGHPCYWEGIKGKAGWSWLLQVTAQAIAPFYPECID